MHVLLVEDDVSLSRYIEKGLTELGYSVHVEDNGKYALSVALTEPFDIAIVDRMLPGLDGLSLVKAMRASQLTLPIIFLTSLGGVDDRVHGLNAGADDYQTKPFAFTELQARLSALSRRAVSPMSASTFEISYGDIRLNLSEHSATRQGQPLRLQHKEFRILEIFMKHPGRVITRTMLLEYVWDIHFEPQTSVVETHISRLRQKLEKPFGDQIIHTVRGAGYKLEHQTGSYD